MENPFALEEQIAEQINHSGPLNSDVLEQLKNDETVLAVYGHIPDANAGIESYIGGFQ
ncbi:hypothetical protein [Methanolapillus ohkumae]|uniref:Uncharacterized protein n=1 Tax=Methanolapillus ohkumae TaxID=3028298 RepID=A0AA96VDK0_9EURY|nr:hypothetical protein MsAm2_00710 [Methanosarcinaceae archaeon Am2]